MHFEFGSSNLRESDRPVLDRVAGVVKEHYPNEAITVGGFADPAGTMRFNQRLGMQRADAVRGYGQSNGSLTGNLRAVS